MKIVLIILILSLTNTKFEEFTLSSTDTEIILYLEKNKNIDFTQDDFDLLFHKGKYEAASYLYENFISIDDQKV